MSRWLESEAARCPHRWSTKAVDLSAVRPALVSGSPICLTNAVRCVR